ncbi:ImmA/IrrE family metallo-endopeptidase [Aequorivita viscosa]|nr:ImmA/IrrE family metallo-endopeptidase [Aequorivita viscosa]
MSKFNQIESIATQTLIDCNLLNAPIDLNRLAKRLNISIEEQDLDDDISGFLLKDKGKTTVGINMYHADVRKRFTLAHEIGHFKLHNIDSPIFVDYSYKGSMLRSKESNKLFRSNRNNVNPTMEKEANFFAANLLMPKILVKKEIEKLNNSLDYDNKVWKLAEVFEVSTQAMDYRLKSLRYYDYGF